MRGCQQRYNSFHMAGNLFRILSPEGTLEEGQNDPPIPVEDQLRLYRSMVLNRRLDERMISLQRQGRIGFYVSSVGEEAAIFGSCFALGESDWVMPCYREIGAAILRGCPLSVVMSQLFGTADDLSEGRQMPNHHAVRSVLYGSVSSPVGTQIPHATGIALAMKLQKKKEVALVYFGDGATSVADFHVGANFAGVFKAPVIFLCRNNQWAISVPREAQTAAETLALKAQAYGFEGVRVDGNDIFAVHEATRRAREKACRGEGPTLIEAVTYRMLAHSTSDDPRMYREEGEVERWKRLDPLKRFRTYLRAQGQWSDEQQKQLEEEVREEILSNLSRAEHAQSPSIATMFEDVYDEVPWHLEEQRRQLREVESPETVGHKV